MIINNMTSVRELVEAWENIAIDLDNIKDEIYSRLKDKKYRNENELENLENLDFLLDNLIDWNLLRSLDSTSDNSFQD